VQRVWATVVLKYSMVGFWALAVLPLVSRVGYGQAAVLAVVVTVLSYALVDRPLLHPLGNEGAVLADFALAVLLYWLLPPWLLGRTVPLGGALVAAGTFAVTEIVYHQYLLRQGTGVR